MAERRVPAGLAPDPLQVMRRVVSEALVLIPAADGAVVELMTSEVLTYVCAAGSLSGSEGIQVPAHGSLSGLSVLANRPLRCDDSETDRRVDREACRRVGVVSMIVLPLPYRQGIAGVLKLSAGVPQAFSDEDVDTLAGLASFIGEAIGGWSQLAASANRVITTWPDDNGLRHQAGGGDGGDKVSTFLSHVLVATETDDDAARQRIRAVLDGPGPAIALQPIVGLKTGNVEGYEALARFEEEPGRPPDEWFAEAHAVGLGVELELRAIELALARLPELPARAYLAVNAGYQVVCDPRLKQLLGGVDAGRVVLELTEHIEIPDYAALNVAIARLRGLGARLAIDDTGAGFASFSHILRLSPDLLKLDRILTTGIDADPARQALAMALVNFAYATRAKVVAEGIETAAELHTIHSLGVDCGQGYLICCPSYDVTTPEPLPAPPDDDGSEPGAERLTWRLA